MVNTGSFCIDSTEVTNAHYVAFLADAGTETGAQDAHCDFNTTTTPSGTWPLAKEKDNVPVGNVDWCDANAFCKWAGKRLCGKISGGSNDPKDMNDASKSQWFHACTGNKGLPFPYGNTFGVTTCNTRGSDGSGGTDGNSGKVLGLLPVKSYKGCEGGFPGVFDLAGNQLEWTDACNKTTGKNDFCNTRGGSAYSNSTNSKCDWKTTSSRSYSYEFVGFRCCADLP